MRPLRPAAVRPLWGSALATLQPGHQDTFVNYDGLDPLPPGPEPRLSGNSPRRSIRWLPLGQAAAVTA